jgi:hypothetical protein
LLATLSFVIRHPRRPDAVVFEQAVEDAPGKGTVRAAALQSEVDQLGLAP